MIELRWLDREMRYPDPQIDPDDHYVDRVLQYRQCIYRDDLGCYGAWSAWQDVPVVKA